MWHANRRSGTRIHDDANFETPLNLSRLSRSNMRFCHQRQRWLQVRFFHRERRESDRDFFHAARARALSDTPDACRVSRETHCAEHTVHDPAKPRRRR